MTDGPGRRYRYRDVPAVPIGGQEELVRPGPAHAPAILPTHALALARRCEAFRTLEEHARDRCEEMGLGSGEVGAVRRDLERLAAQGVLLSLDHLLERGAGARATETAVPPIGTIGIVTCDRPGALGRGLASHAEGVRGCGREVEFLVVDDSRDPGAPRAMRALLGTLAAERAIRIRYAGRQEKARFAAALASETGVADEVVAFAMFDPEGVGMTAGANRNALLLATAGDVALSVDDDVVWRTARIPGAAPGLALDSGTTPWQWWFFPDRARLLGALAPGPPDALAAHEGLLGRDPSACLGEHAAGGHDLGGAGAGLLGLLESGRGRVVLTMSGRAGDSGMTDPIALDLEGPSRERLVESEVAYGMASTSREVIRGVVRPTIGDRMPCSTLALGLDNRQGLPPFFPVGRGQDVVFGLVVRACVTGACVGSLPVALLHAPPETRAFAPGDVWRLAASYRVAWLLIDCLGTLVDSVVGAEAPARTRALGWRLCDLASLAPTEFRDHVSTARRMRGSVRIARLEAALEAFEGAPDFWAADVRRHVETLRDTLARDDVDVPDDLRAGRDPDQARARARRLVGRYGELLRAWPDLVEGARRLRARGIELGEPPA